MAKRVGMMTELDEATMAWLEGHHIRPKDVRAWNADGRVGDLTTMTIEFMVSDVDTLPEAKPVVLTFDNKISKADFDEFANAWREATRKPRTVEVDISERSARVRHDDGTILKVRNALQEVGLHSRQITDAIHAMQNKGILFRESA